MTDNEIIKDLNRSILNAKMVGRRVCSLDVYKLKSVLDLINRQKAEIERLQNENKSIRYCYEQAKSYNDKLAESCEKNCKKFNMTTRSEAIKEFAEMLKGRLTGIGRSTIYGNFEYGTIKSYEIDNLVKEMTEVETNQ